MGSIGTVNTSKVYNPTQDMTYYEGLPRYTGRIFSEDVKDYADEYGLTSEPVKMVVNGEWETARGPVKSYIFADGTHANMQFTRGRGNIFYLETLERRR